MYHYYSFTEQLHPSVPRRDSHVAVQVFRVDSINGVERKYANPDTDDRHQVSYLEGLIPYQHGCR